MDNNFALFIDDLRKSRNISRTDFVQDIISDRHYYRFIKGESSLKSETLMKLFDRLQLNTNSMIKLIANNSYNNNKDLVEAYNALYENKYKDSYEKLSKINYDEIKTEYQQKMYKIVNIISSYNLKLMSKSKAISETKELIEYPSILDKDSLNVIESCALNFISIKLIEEGDHRIASFTYERLINQADDSSKSVNDLILYNSLAKSLGAIKEYEKARNIAKLGISEYISTSSLNVMESLLCLQALTEKYLNKPEAAKKSLTRLFALLYSEDNVDRFKEYEELLKKKFNLKVSDLVKFP